MLLMAIHCVIITNITITIILPASDSKLTLQLVLFYCWFPIVHISHKFNSRLGSINSKICYRAYNSNLGPAIDKVKVIETRAVNQDTFVSLAYKAATNTRVHLISTAVCAFHCN